MLPIHTMPGYLIRRAHQISTALFAERVSAACIDITPVQFGALSAIRSQPGLDQATLAELIAYDRVTIGGVLDRLQTKGLIQRTVSEVDRRARRLHLTPAGEKMLVQLSPIVADVQAEILSGFTAEERDVFVVLLKKLHDVPETSSTLVAVTEGPGTALAG